MLPTERNSNQISEEFKSQTVETSKASLGYTFSANILVCWTFVTDFFYKSDSIGKLSGVKHIRCSGMTSQLIIE
jgi:hypothetical protein